MFFFDPLYLRLYRIDFSSAPLMLSISYMGPKAYYDRNGGRRQRLTTCNEGWFCRDVSVSAVRQLLCLSV